MSMRRLTPAFVATLSALTTTMACNPPRPLPGNPPPQSLPGNPPQPVNSGESGAGETGEGAADGQGTSTAPTPKPGAKQELNPRDTEGRTIHLNYNDDGCFVYLPFPELKPGETRVPGTAPPSQPVDCPAIMKDPAFAKCRGGSLSRKGDSCECFQPGNPPRVSPSDCPQ